MGVTTSENMLLAGLGFLVIACVFFILFGFVLSVKTPKTEDLFKPLSIQAGVEQGGSAVQQGNQAEPVRELSILWVALLALSIIVMLIGAKLVFQSTR
jgi:hypothetical protein